MGGGSTGAGMEHVESGSTAPRKSPSYPSSQNNIYPSLKPNILRQSNRKRWRSDPACRFSTDIRSSYTCRRADRLVAKFTAKMHSTTTTANTNKVMLPTRDISKLKGGGWRPHRHGVGVRIPNDGEHPTLVSVYRQSR
jgi:hypothetical protein